LDQAVENSGEVVLQGVGSGIGPPASTDLAVDVDEVSLNGIDRDRKFAGDLFIAVTSCHEAEQLRFPLR
jgi:hypothetical protein